METEGLSNLDIGLLLEAFPAPVLMADETGVVCAANKDAHLLFGYEAGKMVGVPSEALVVEDLRRSVTDLRSRFASGDRSIPSGNWLLRRYLRGDGSEFMARVNFIPVFSNDAFFIVSTFQDPAGGDTNLVQLQNLIEAGPDAIVGVDEEGIIRFVNRQTETMFGYNRVELLGQPLEILIPERFRDIHFIHRSHYFREPRTRAMGAGMQLAGLKRDGTEFDVDISLAAFPSEGGVVATAAIRDISDQVSARKRAALEARAEQVQRLEALGQLAGGVAHDFNNLLAIILNYADFIKSEAEDPDAVRSDVAEIIAAAQRAADLTRQLLMFGRRDVLHATAIDLNQLINEAMTLLRSAVGDSVEVVVKTGADVRNVLADQTHVEQVLLNLAINSRDAMADGGKVIIETKTHVVSEGDDLTAQLDTGEYVCLSVSDTGSGMSKETMSRAFEPFFTTKSKEKGTGLGLATVYGVVSRAGGTVTLYSEAGSGTTIRVYLPVDTVNEELAAPRPQIHASAPVVTGQTVMVVEDEVRVKEMITRILEDAGYVVVVTESPGHALKLLKSDLPVNLLISDVSMPEMSGPELTGKARELRSSLGVLLLSGHPHELLKDAGVPQPAAFLEKPFTAEQLLECVAVAVAGSASV
jgi:PAS domain S-box-containing protein